MQISLKIKTLDLFPKKMFIFQSVKEADGGNSMCLCTKRKGQRTETSKTETDREKETSSSERSTSFVASGHTINKTPPFSGHVPLVVTQTTPLILPQVTLTIYFTTIFYSVNSLFYFGNFKTILLDFKYFLLFEPPFLLFLCLNYFFSHLQ